MPANIYNSKAIAGLQYMLSFNSEVIEYQMCNFAFF